MECFNDVLKRIKGGLIVSCQALEDEPLHSSFIMSKMARAAVVGGAVGIRANTPEDCMEIKNEVDLPLIAIYKKVYEGSSVFITPTIKEFKEIAKVGAEIIAVDATKRTRPDGKSLDEYVKEMKKIYNGLLMADISTYEEGIEAARLGFDIISTTLSGYTEYSMDSQRPNIELVKRLSDAVDIPIIAEGNIETPMQAAECIKNGAFAVVVGGTITRPHLITKKFVNGINERAI